MNRIGLAAGSMAIAGLLAAGCSSSKKSDVSSGSTTSAGGATTSAAAGMKVAVLDDASEYGKGLADTVRSKVKDGGATVTVSESIDPKGSDYSSTVNKVKSANVAAVFYGGYYESAGRLMKQLHDAGVQAPFVAGDGSLDAKFIDAAGSQGEGAVLLAPGAYTASDASFAQAYKALTSSDPALYSGEAYDAANHVLAAIKAGKATRADINAYLGSTPYKGLLKTYSYQADGELQGGGAIIQHVVKSGKIAVVGPVGSGSSGASTTSTSASTSTSAASTSSSAAGGASSCPAGAKIGFFGALTGSDAALGINERNGVKVALSQLKTATGCDIKLEEYDSQGDPAQAPALAQKAVADKNVLAIIGPAFSGESKQADPIFNEAGLPIVTASATNATLSKNGWKIFHRAVANDDAQGPAAATYILSLKK